MWISKVSETKWRGFDVVADTPDTVKHDQPYSFHVNYVES